MVWHVWRYHAAQIERRAFGRFVYGQCDVCCIRQNAGRREQNVYGTHHPVYFSIFSEVTYPLTLGGFVRTMDCGILDAKGKKSTRGVVDKPDRREKRQ